MNNIFSMLKQYASKWTVKEVRNFTKEEIDSVVSNEVISSEYGNSVCLLLVTGSKVYIPCDRDCTKGVGESIDMEKCLLKTLTRPGEKDIYRIME